MSTSRAVTIVGAYRWRFNTRARAWEVIGRPGIRVTPTVLKARGGRVRAAWVLEPNGGTYREYEQAMMAAEEKFGVRTRLSRSRL